MLHPVAVWFLAPALESEPHQAPSLPLPRLWDLGVAIPPWGCEAVAMCHFWGGRATKLTQSLILVDAHMQKVGGAGSPTPGTPKISDLLLPEGRSIGLCDGKLQAMSGEEVDGMELSELAKHVQKVELLRQELGGAGGSPSQTLTLRLPDAGVCILQDQPQTQAQDHQGTQGREGGSRHAMGARRCSSCVWNLGPCPSSSDSQSVEITFF